MFYILSEVEGALNELLVSFRKSIFHYEDAIKSVQDKDIGILFRGIVTPRKSLINALTNAIRDLGDLPSEPDPDQETTEMIIERVGASLSEDDDKYIISTRIHAEQELQELVEQAKELDISESVRRLLADVSKHISETIKALKIQGGLQ
jgi:hypothetical protein